MIRSWRAAALVLGAATAGVLLVAGPAAADVTVSPSEAPRGGPAELAFTIPDEHPGAYTTKVELIAPAATPIAEIYPMSTDNWAPTITTRKLDHPIELIHGTTTTEVPASIVWIRVSDTTPTPGQPAELTVSLGPLPTTERVAFTVVQTYSDGTVVRWGDPAAPGDPQHPAPTVRLVDQGATAGHDHSDTGQTAGAAPPAQNGKTGENGTYGILGAGLLVGLAAGLGLDGWFILRAVRRRSAPATALGGTAVGGTAVGAAALGVQAEHH